MNQDATINNREALDRMVVRAVVEGRGRPVRIPVLLHFWVFTDTFEDRRAAVEHLLAQYPQDCQQAPLIMPDVFEAPGDDPEYRWAHVDDPYAGRNVAFDERVALHDWAAWPQMREQWPHPDYPAMFANAPKRDGRYRLGNWWFCLFERHWSLRGMTNALMDFYTDPQRVHELYEALTGFYCRAIERAATESGCDGIFVSDDLGTQESTFFSIDIFREFFKPYYRRMIETAHRHSMHFWLHTCGNIEQFIPEFIDIGLDVLHPIQKHTLNEQEVARRYGKDICIWAGFDVQRTLPQGTPQEVRDELRFLLNTYDRPEGRLLLGAGNVINGGCPLDNLEALFDEAFRSSGGC